MVIRPVIFEGLRSLWWRAEAIAYALEEVRE
jgi:hypothetical protein